MSRSYLPADPDRLGEVLAARIDRRCTAHPVRVAIDGPECCQPGVLTESIITALRALGRDAIQVRADTFWRDASVRLEHGRTDEESFLREWLDDGALRREVLEPLGAHGSRTYLPSLRDPATNRTTREPTRVAARDAVLLVSGGLLLGRDLPFDLTIHLALSADARHRRTSAEWAWTLPVYERYDAETDPVRRADVVVRLNDPRHPAISVE